jgi:hypothetical protein
MNKIENSFKKTIEELKRLNIRYFKLNKQIKNIDSDVEYIERKE